MKGDETSERVKGEVNDHLFWNFKLGLFTKIATTLLLLINKASGLTDCFPDRLIVVGPHILVFPDGLFIALVAPFSEFVSW